MSDLNRTIQPDLNPVKTGQTAVPATVLLARLKRNSIDRDFVSRLEIRNFVKEDGRKLFHFWTDLYFESASNENFRVGVRPEHGEALRWAANLSEMVAEQRAVAKTAEHGDKLVGLCCVTTEKMGSKEPFLDIYITSEFRHKGLGTRLMAAAEGASKGLFNAINLLVDSKNVNAKGLYLKRGFVQVFKENSGWNYERMRLNLRENAL